MPKTINLRDLPDELVKQAKMYAISKGMTLKAFVIAAMKAAMVPK